MGKGGTGTLYVDGRKGQNYSDRRLKGVPAEVPLVEGAIIADAITTPFHAVVNRGQVRPGDEVVVPSFTFYATAESIARRGATPVFAEIDPATAFALVREATRRALGLRLYDVQLVAASHQNLPQLVQEKKFRSDLYFRISTIPLRVPVSLASRCPASLSLGSSCSTWRRRLLAATPPQTTRREQPSCVSASQARLVRLSTTAS